MSFYIIRCMLIANTYDEWCVGKALESILVQIYFHINRAEFFFYILEKEIQEGGIVFV